MIIDIKDELFYKLIDLMKNRNVSIYNELKAIKSLTFKEDLNTLQQAREIKTQRIRETIKETIKSLLNQNINPTKYKIHKITKIAFVTLNKYYDDILKEVSNEKIIKTTI